MKSRQYTFFGDHKALEALSQKGDRLEEFNRLLKIEGLVALAEGIWREKELKTRRGCKPWSSELMLRVLLLRRFYNLSDNDLEYQLRDRLSFMRFVGLGLGDEVPDAKTIWHYREQLSNADASRGLFDKFNEILMGLGLSLREGVMIDATFVLVPIQRNKRDENEIVKDGDIPFEWRGKPAKLSHKDVDADWGKKGNVSYYGYKDHVKTGGVTKLIKDYKDTPASVHDSVPAPDLIKEGDQVVYADSAYSGEPIAADLCAKKVENRIHEKATRDHPLTSEQKENNRIKSKTRARVEHPFAFMEKSLGKIYNRCVGAVRNRYEIGMMNLAYNMWRAIFLIKNPIRQRLIVP